MLCLISSEITHSFGINPRNGGSPPMDIRRVHKAIALYGLCFFHRRSILNDLETLLIIRNNRRDVEIRIYVIR